MVHASTPAAAAAYAPSITNVNSQDGSLSLYVVGCAAFPSPGLPPRAAPQGKRGSCPRGSCTLNQNSSLLSIPAAEAPGLEILQSREF